MFTQFSVQDFLMKDKIKCYDCRGSACKILNGDQLRVCEDGTMCWKWSIRSTDGPNWEERGCAYERSLDALDCSNVPLESLNKLKSSDYYPMVKLECCYGDLYNGKRSPSYFPVEFDSFELMVMVMQLLVYSSLIGLLMWIVSKIPVYRGGHYETGNGQGYMVGVDVTATGGYDHADFGAGMDFGGGMACGGGDCGI